MMLTFDLLTPKVDRFMPLAHKSLVPVCITVGSFVFKRSCSQVPYLTNGQTENIPRQFSVSESLKSQTGVGVRDWLELLDEI